jgi:hypothetical protein
MTNKLTLSEVKDIIDSHLESENNFMFACDFSLAHYIYDYLHNDYEIVAECLELSTEIEEYYLSVTFYPKDNEICLICENAKCSDGEYKYNDICDGIDYFIFIDIDKNIAYEKLCGEGSWSWCELVEDNEVKETNVENDCGNCDGCCDNDDELEDDECDCPICQAEQEVQELDCYCEECNSEFEKEAIEECLNIIFDNSCPDCIVKSVVNLGYKFKEIGKQSVKQEIRDFLDDED